MKWVPSWSRDGVGYICTSNLSDELQVWKMPSTGAPAVQVTRHGGFITRRTIRVFDLENRPALGAPGLAVSPDRKSILYTQLDALNSDIMLVENFR